MNRRKLASLLIAVAVALAIAECAVRAIGTTDAHGQFYVRGQPVPPYGARTETLLASVERFANSAHGLRTNYHPKLGWAPRAGHRGPRYVYNNDAIRSDLEHERSPRPDRLRIATFGDSFTHGDEVANSETWPQALESELLALGVRAEVLNFGMSGYGMDQALLRWRIEGRRFDPDLVLFGLNPENMGRNINVFRPALHPRTELPLTKPRFVVAGGRLELVNSPTIPPALLPAFVRDFRNHPLFRHEGHASKLADRRWWQASRLAALVEARTTGSRERARLKAEQFRVTSALLRRFGTEVERSGAGFVLVHVFPRFHLAQLQQGRRMYYRPLLDSLARRYATIETATLFERTNAGDWAPLGHYSASANRRIGKLIAGRILECVANGSCRPKRGLPPLTSTEDLVE